MSKRNKPKYKYKVIIQLEFNGMGSNIAEAIDYITIVNGNIDLNDYNINKLTKLVKRISKPLSQSNIDNFQDNYNHCEANG